MLKLTINRGYMKRYILSFLFFFLLNTCFGVSYNYYHRNELTGFYQIKNLENIPEQYRFKYSMHDNQVVGYYYDSSIIKFIDIVNGDRVIKSTYFSKETGKVVAEKKFYYGDNSEIKSFMYKQMNDHGDVIYETKSFFSKKENKIVYNSIGYMVNENIEHRLIIDGLLFENYQPSSYKVSGMVIAETNKMAQSFNAEEVFSYDGCKIISKLFQNGKLCRIKRKFLDDKIPKYEEIIFNINEEQIASKQYILTDSILTQIIKTNTESIDEYNYLRIDDSCFLLSYNDWDDSPAIKIETSDEIVYIKNEIVEELKYPTSLFNFSIF